MNIKNFLNFILFFLFFNSPITLAKETWKLDKNLSSINFELSVLFANNVKGTFKDIEGLVEIDLENNKNNKAIFSVTIDSIEMNYSKYKPLLLSDIFFDIDNFPIALVDTRKFSYKNEKKLIINAELIIKDKSKITPISLEVYHLTTELIQIKGKLTFSRTFFNIGTGIWSSKAILTDNANIFINLFLFKE